VSGRAGNRGRRPSRDESALFRAVMHDVAPRRARAPLPEATPPSDPAPVRTTSAPAPRPAAQSSLPNLALGVFAGIDKRSALRLKRGQYPIEERLDLHGLIQAEAHQALNDFVAEAAHSGRRCVLVITGKGRRGRSGAPEGILQRMVPHWLNQPLLRRLILGAALAQPRHGGAGALYLLLRRRC
jgi:DNA-nicking Smr family endonuclease